ncbi:hypothetical protein K435DRAFT_802455 [Dendrothele bispora CBS 962.96]|uniref:Ribonuclease H1 N-terminal domain-containing protein n=1 Tax=Dendrothele bispora (strain CBS 962.96) TaxID=1314807 RepID=A0A4V4HE89_DENBC|nr:hypothetical protein K435DRAFT_802455 [Dendrothele bispora CBS 962.96]
MVVNDPGEFLPPAYIYTGFAQLAHPDELPWDGRRGTKDIYVVTHGRRVGIFADWVLVEDLAKGVRDAYFRKCDSVDEAVALYTAVYNQLPGHKKLEVVPVGPSIDNPIVNDRSSLIRGQDVDIVVREVPTLTFHVIPAKTESPIHLTSTPLVSQVLSPSKLNKCVGSAGKDEWGKIVDDCIEILSSDEEMTLPFRPEGTSDADALLANVFKPCLDPDRAGDWEWVKQGTKPPDVRSDTSGWQLPNVPFGQRQGRLWMFASLYKRNGPDFPPAQQRYIDALLAAVASQNALSSGFITWDDPSFFAAGPLDANMDDAAWCQEQVQRCRNWGSISLPTITGLEVQRRRIAIFDEMKSVQGELKNSRLRLFQLGRSWWEIRGCDDGIEGKIWSEVLQENERRQLLQSQLLILDGMAINICFLTGVVLLHGV